jgi:hypothetical protein
MSNSTFNDFGVVDPLDDYYELRWETGKAGQCILTATVQTERGPSRTELAEIPAALWRTVCERVVRELIEGMGDTERSKKAPALQRGVNRMSPLIGRELAILLWALMEAGSSDTEAILHGWRELAREERWWLYAKAAAPGQRAGTGWRRALFHALSETPDSRAAESAATEKKSPGNGLLAQGEASAKRKPAQNQPSPKRTDNIKAPAASRKKKQAPDKPVKSKKPAMIPKSTPKKAKKINRKMAA